MAPRRSTFDPLQPTDRPCWFVAEDQWHHYEEVRPIPPGTDLRRDFLVTLLRYHDAGWQLEDGHLGSWFCRRGRQRLQLVILPEDPRRRDTPAGRLALPLPPKSQAG